MTYYDLVLIYVAVLSCIDGFLLATLIYLLRELHKLSKSKKQDPPRGD